MPAKLPGQVAIEENVVFGSGGDRDLTCDVFTPPDDATSRPAVLFLHGGAWQSGDKAQLKYYGIQLARYGYLCVCSEYRLSDEAVWPAQLHDAKTAIRWMRSHADSLAIDPDRIAVSGNSAGGHIALMLAATPDTPGLEGDGGHDQSSSGAHAAIAIYPPTLLVSTDVGGAVERLFGAEPSQEKSEAASPVTYAHRGFPPTMLIHGNADELVPVRSSLLMYEALSDAGAAVEIHIFDGQPHAFDTNAEFARQIADLSALFLGRNLAVSATDD